MSAAILWTFSLRWFEALVMSLKASSWLQRFWAMMTPQARLMTVLVAIAFRSALTCCKVSIRSTRRKVLPATRRSLRLHR